MLNYFKELLNVESETSADAEPKSTNSGNRKLQMATCALMLELANSDDDFSKDEKDKIFSLMKKTFDLTDEEVSNLFKISEEAVKRSVSMYEFTEVINEFFDNDQKYEVLKNLWRLIFADEKLTSHEEYFIRKISGNMHLEHRDFIAAKLEVKKEMNIS